MCSKDEVAGSSSENGSGNVENTTSGLERGHVNSGHVLEIVAGSASKDSSGNVEDATGGLKWGHVNGGHVHEA